MKILAPVNSPKEVNCLIDAGCDEIYCGLITSEWKKNYTNIASPNRREWTSANIAGFNQLKEVVDIAHSRRIPVFLTLNALYTEQQYPHLFKQIDEAIEIGVDAFIVADIGLLLALRKMKINIEIHISTGGTTFNSETARFYKELGGSRIVLPRHLRVDEIEELVQAAEDISFEVFILNSGCKNIDGFCTFHHGVNEVLHPRLWNMPKKLNFDRALLNWIRRLPGPLAERLRGNVFGIDSACLLDYRVSVYPDGKIDKKEMKLLKERISRSFSLLYGADPCGGCSLADFRKIGIHSVKIVGRNYSTKKKVLDVKFLRSILNILDEKELAEFEFKRYVKDLYKQVYGLDCGEICYYFE
jgi:putative protease